MNYKILTAGLLLASLNGAQSLHAQGATQAVRGTALGLQNAVADNQKPITAGPADTQEKLSPGKIDANAPREFQTTTSGLKYRILRKTEGRKPKATDTVDVNYKGWLNDESVFDSSYRQGKSISFPLNKVIKGWTEGVQLMSEGAMIELDIPYQLAYGERGTPGGPIPPKAQLHFIIELNSIK
jgi:FKBP-type peptidyl-prolyl cis-trans isomerase FkpA